MKGYECYSRRLMWVFSVCLLTALMAGCGGSGGNGSWGGDASPGATKAISDFSLEGFTGTINETEKTIAVTMPFGTSVTALVATSTTTGTSVKVGTTVQISGTTANDFTSPVLYTVTGVDRSRATYTVTVTIAAVSAKAMTAFSLAGVAGTINETAKTIAVAMPSGTNLTALVATFSTTGAGVKIGATIQSSGTTANSFVSPVTYTVTAADDTTAAYVVTVTIAAASAKAITAFSFTGVSGTINEPAKTIAVAMPFGTNVTALVATFTTTGAGVKVGATVQASGKTANSFAQPVIYTVAAADGTAAAYTVTVTVAALLKANPVAPVLGETARFVMLASQRVTTTSGSLIYNGDIGIIDLARSAYAGFTAGASPGQFTELKNGLSYAPDDMPPFTYPSPYASSIAFINQVRTDLGNANSFLAADPNPGAPTQVCPIELGKLVLTRGVYKTAANVTIQTGDLVLDAQGDPNAVWIFSIGGTLSTGAPGGNIKLINKAQAKNIYWRTSSSTIIGAGKAFYGNVFAWSQVNVLAGANVTGRLFAVTDQVTLISNAVTKAP